MVARPTIMVAKMVLTWWTLVALLNAAVVAAKMLMVRDGARTTQKATAAEDQPET